MVCRGRTACTYSVKNQIDSRTMYRARLLSCLLVFMICKYKSHPVSIQHRRLLVPSNDPKLWPLPRISSLRGGCHTEEEQTVIPHNDWKLQPDASGEKEDKLTEEDFSDCSYEYQEIKPRLRQDSSAPPPVLGAQVDCLTLTYCHISSHSHTRSKLARSGTVRQPRDCLSMDASRCDFPRTALSCNCPAAAREVSSSPAALPLQSTCVAPMQRTGPSCNTSPAWPNQSPPLLPAHPTADPAPAAARGRQRPPAPPPR